MALSCVSARPAPGAQRPAGETEAVLATSELAKGENPVTKFLIAGSMTAVFELACGHYLEFLKIAKQTQAGSYAQITREITAKKGFVGVWDGFFPWGLLQALVKGAVFGSAHSFMKNTLQPHVDSGALPSQVAEVCAGGFGGGVQGFALSPILLLKTRVMTDPIFRTNMSMWQTSVKSATVGMGVIRSEGFAALMKGSGIFATKRVADWSTRFMFSVLVEEAMLAASADKQRKLATWEKLTAGLAGGTLSALSTIPIDVMVAQIQQASKAGQNVSVVDTFMEQYRLGGMQQIVGFATKGFVARVAHVALTTALMKTMTSAVYDWYVGR